MFLKNFLTSLFFAILVPVSLLAETKPVYLHSHKKDISDSSKQNNRAPMQLPIVVTYDTNTKNLIIDYSENLSAEIIIYDSDGSIFFNSETLISTIAIPNSGTYTIMIQGSNWYADGTFVI